MANSLEMNNENHITAPTTSSLITEERHDSELFRVYALILDGITDHILPPGQKLTESDLCRQAYCSRNTVRGALSLLAQDKIVDLLPNRGAFVHEPDLKETRDVFTARIEIEEMILGLLLDLPDLQERLIDLYKMIDNEEKAYERGDHVVWNRLTNAFHVELTKLLRNDVLTGIMNVLCARTSLIIAVFDGRRLSKRACTYNEHRQILDLLHNKKRTRVYKAMRRHLSEALERLEYKFESK